MAVIETMTFRLVEGADESAFLLVDKRLQTEFAYQQPGLVRRTTARGVDAQAGEWVVIDLWATSNVFLAGHRIRLQITSSSVPRWDRNQNTGHPIGADAELAVAWQTILHDVEHASYVVLPVVE